MLRRQIAPAVNGRRSLTASSCFALHTNTHMRALDLTSFRRFEPNKDCASSPFSTGGAAEKDKRYLSATETPKTTTPSVIASIVST